MDQFGRINETTLISSVHDPQPGGHAFCPDASCDSMLYGSLQLGLQRKSLWPRKQPDEILSSLEELGNIISNLSISSLKCLHKNVHRCHSPCFASFNYPERVAELLMDIESPVDELLLQHMENQKGNGRWD